MNLTWQVCAADIIWGNFKWAMLSRDYSYLHWYQNGQVSKSNHTKNKGRKEETWVKTTVKFENWRGYPYREYSQNYYFWDSNSLLFILLIYEEISVTSASGAQNIKNKKKIHVKSLADGYWQPPRNTWEKVLKLRVQGEWLLHMQEKTCRKTAVKAGGTWELEISVGRPNEVETILNSVMF